MRLLLTEIGILDKKGQYMKIKVLKENKGIEQIKANAIGQEGEAPSILINTAFPTSPIQTPTLILLKRDN